MRAVVLAGGMGTRLSPFTSVFPKPLMPIDGVPILQIVSCQLKKEGFDHVTFAVGHMADMIKTYFGDGSKFGLRIDYSFEHRPLGTIGALSLIEDLPDQFMVMNGDILTDLNFAEFFAYHKKHGAVATIATYLKKIQIEYGIVESNHDNAIFRYNEKPTLEYQVSMGVYAFNSNLFKYIQKGHYLDFPDLVTLLIKKGERIAHFAFDGYWMDIGCHADYEKAANDYNELKERIFRDPTIVAHKKAVVRGK